MQHSTSSALVVSGWHRKSYNYNDDTKISKQLEGLIRKLHAFVGNAVTRNRYIVLGAGSTQILNAAASALSLENTSSHSPTRVIASVPYYSLYKEQVEYFNAERLEFEGEAYTWRNRSDGRPSTNVIEFVTSPNNPDGRLNKAIVGGPSVKTISDRAYYWPHFTPIPAPADEDLMVFTLSKLTGHAGSRFGWAVIKDETVFNRMVAHMDLNSMGVSRDTQLRAFKLLKAVLEEGTGIFDFAYRTMKTIWERLAATLALSNRFSLQKFNPQYCSFYSKITYAWVKREREEDKDCYAVLKAANIIGRQGNIFGSEDRYVRLSLVRSQDDLDILIHRLRELVSAGTM
ncbi:Tryptophan aminotransferase-related protein 3 [Hibiscus syriacus]|uniref:Tryptophan aminotransferase-related protein 3 n=1 Tax=Hibiscus syriacus TaxID=106335 RepID=A0A6A2WVM1_HIBSY|nr:Tryptophan aminotransferase-related protein 3 [Hibiscus syriacus]